MRRIHALTHVLPSAMFSLLVACDQSAPTSLHPSTTPSSLAGRGGEVIVTGGGQYTGDFGLAKVAIHVIRYADGTVTGQYQQTESEPAVTVHGVVDCAVTSGNRVFVSGIITNVLKANESNVFEGGGFMLLIEDNGEGLRAPPDRASSFLFPARPQSCTNVSYQQYLLGLWTYDLESGNFQTMR